MQKQKSLETDKNHRKALGRAIFFGYIYKFKILHLKY